MTKKKTALLLGGSLLATLTGCGLQNAGTAPTNPPPAQTSAPAASPAPVSGDVSLMPKTTTINGKTVTGPNPKAGQTVSVQYTGTLLDGTKFDSSYDHGGRPIDFPIGVGSVIKGWDEGVPTMKVGGQRRLVIPAALAYGARPPTASIPPNAPLVFDIELVAVK